MKKKSLKICMSYCVGLSLLLFLQQSEALELHFQESLLPSESCLDSTHERQLLHTWKEKEKQKPCCSCFSNGQVQQFLNSILQTIVQFGAAGSRGYHPWVPVVLPLPDFRNPAAGSPELCHSPRKCYIDMGSLCQSPFCLKFLE